MKEKLSAKVEVFFLDPKISIMAAANGDPTTAPAPFTISSPDDIATIWLGGRKSLAWAMKSEYSEKVKPPKIIVKTSKGTK